jgi:hypothetical protein
MLNASAAIRPPCTHREAGAELDLRLLALHSTEEMEELLCSHQVRNWQSCGL